MQEAGEAVAINKPRNLNAARPLLVEQAIHPGAARAHAGVEGDFRSGSLALFEKLPPEHINIWHGAPLIDRVGDPEIRGVDHLKDLHSRDLLAHHLGGLDIKRVVGFRDFIVDLHLELIGHSILLDDLAHLPIQGARFGIPLGSSEDVCFVTVNPPLRVVLILGQNGVKDPDAQKISHSRVLEEFDHTVESLAKLRLGAGGAIERHLRQQDAPGRLPTLHQGLGVAGVETPEFFRPQGHLVGIRNRFGPAGLNQIESPLFARRHGNRIDLNREAGPDHFSILEPRLHRVGAQARSGIGGNGPAHGKCGESALIESSFARFPSLGVPSRSHRCHRIGDLKWGAPDHMGIHPSIADLGAMAHAGILLDRHKIQSIPLGCDWR